MNTEAAVSFVAGFDVSAFIAAEMGRESRESLALDYQEAKNLAVLAIKNPGFGVVPTQRGDRHALFEDDRFLDGLRAHGVEFKHVPEAAGDFPKTVEMYHREFGVMLRDPAGCLVEAAGCLLEAITSGAAGCLLEAVSSS